VHGVLVFGVLAPQLGIVLLKDFHQIVVIALQFLQHRASLAVELTTDGTRSVCVFAVLGLTPVAATGTNNPNGLQQEPELLTIPAL
jgi:hypothetical protein